MVGVEHTAWVWLEGDQDAGGPGCAGAGDQRLQQGEVAPMDAVKAADGGVAGAEGPGRWKTEADRGHHAKTARGWIRRVASASPQASRSPSGPSNRYRPAAALGAGTVCPRRTAAAPAASSATAGQLRRGRSIGRSRRVHPSPSAARVAIGTASAPPRGPNPGRVNPER